MVERVPETYTVIWQPEERDVLEDLARARQVFDRLRVVLLLLVVLNVALLGLVWLLAVRSPAEWLRWTGGPLLFLGLLALLATLLIPQVVSWGFDNSTLWVEGNVPAPLAQALERAILDFILLLFRPALFVSAALVAIGLLLMLISALFPGRRQRVPPVT
jgi:hypothetical protein